MKMPLPLLLTIYCALVLLASLVGGWLPIVMRLTHRGMELAISFVAGVILGVGVLHLLPHSVHELGSIDEAMRYVLGGFLLMFFVERFFHFHHHGPPDELSAAAAYVPEAHAHGSQDEGAGDHDARANRHGQHQHAAAHAPHVGGGQFSWAAAAVGLTLHGLVEGIALAAAVAAERGENPTMVWAGFGTWLAIALHKPFDSLTILTLMTAGHVSSGRRHLINALYALVVPCGVLAYSLASDSVGNHEAFLGRSLAFAAGTFLCIATSDLLPELQFHSHDRFKLSLALVLGLGLAWGLVQLESQGHEHHEHSQPAVLR